MVELYLHSPMSSWNRTLLIKHRDNFTFLPSTLFAHGIARTFSFISAIILIDKLPFNINYFK
jgi:hypothetical protein